MAENPLPQVNDDSGSDESEESNGPVLRRLRKISADKSTLPSNRPICSKLSLPEHIAAYCEKRELIRDATPISCDNAIVEKAMSNYIIAKEILSNLSWQDKGLCKHVCTTWRSAVNSLVREHFHLVDFVYNMQHKVFDHDRLIKSDDFHKAPMAILVFVNNAGSAMTAYCKDIIPCPCKTPCKAKLHSSKSLLRRTMYI